MASPSTETSSGSSLIRSGSDEDLQLLMNEKKRKRMLSNRESARRSRMRKQKHLDDLMSQVRQLKHDNSQILTSLTLTTQHYYSLETQNNVLRTQMVELNKRLQSLNEILHYMNPNNNNNINHHHHNNNNDYNHNYNNYYGNEFLCDGTQMMNDHSLINPWNNLSCMNQPIMASADMFQY